MSEEPTDADALNEAERLRRRADVFGEVLPDRTSDERGDDEPESIETEVWLRRQVPPHHG
jgi:hypothetical protein